MIIRRVKKEDFEQVFALEQSCFKDPYSRKHLEYEFSSNPVNVFLVAEDEKQIVGFIDFLITFNSATIVQIAVKNEYRNKGIATKLLNEMENTFPKDIDDVVENVTLEVRETNKAALTLYKKNGYEIIVTKKHYYPDGEDAIYMVKRMLLCQ